MSTALRNVPFQGQSGKHLLALSFSDFNPSRKWPTRHDFGFEDFRRLRANDAASHKQSSIDPAYHRLAPRRHAKGARRMKQRDGWTADDDPKPPATARNDSPPA